MQQIADWLKKLGMSEYASALPRAISTLRPSRPDRSGPQRAWCLAWASPQNLTCDCRLRSSRRANSDVAVAAVAADRAAPRHCRTPTSHNDVLRLGGLDGAVSPHGPGRPSRGHFGLSEVRRADRGSLGGFVAKYMGDGVLVYFGFPQAHEDDAERAVRAGLELVAAVGGLKTHAPLQTRVGIATGLVVVGDIIGSGDSQEQAS